MVVSNKYLVSITTLFLLNLHTRWYLVNGRAINSSVILDLWSRNINWAELVDQGPKEFMIENEKITVKLENQMSTDKTKEIAADVEVFRESKESSVEHSISEVIYMDNGWEIIIKNPKLNSCF